jgi:Peptidase family M28
MKKWIWLVLVFAMPLATSFAGIALMVIGGKYILEKPPQPIDTIRVEMPQQKLFSAVSSPVVSSERLLAHIQNLNFQRYTDTERSRTRNYIIAELRKSGWTPKLERFAEGVNIVAERSGTDQKAGAILVGAHYDSVFQSPGADDNASGVAVVLEVARLLRMEATPRTLKLVLFDKEEAGLLGSQAFAAKKTHLKDLRGAIVMDMVGYACYTPGCQKYPKGIPIKAPSDKGDFLAVVGDTEHLPLLNSFQQNVQDTQFPTVLTVPIPLKGLLTPDTLRSDHAPFWYQGVGAVLVTDTANLRTPHYHKSSDISNTIDSSFFTGSAQVIVNTTKKLLESSNSLSTPQANKEN